MEVIFDMPLKVTHCFSLSHFYFSVNQGFKEIIDWPNISFSLCYLFNDHYLFNEDLKQKSKFIYTYGYINVWLYISIFERTQKAFVILLLQLNSLENDKFPFQIFFAGEHCMV